MLESPLNTYDNISYLSEDSDQQGYCFLRWTFQEKWENVAVLGDSEKIMKNVKKNSHSPNNQFIKNPVHTNVSVT